MSQAQLTKIINQLNKQNEKLMVLALMQIPSLKSDLEYNQNDIQSLAQIISTNVLSNNPDISYLSRKAANHMQNSFQVVPVDETVILGAISEDNDEFITVNESFSKDPLTLEKQLLDLPSNYQDHDNLLPFLMHSSNRIIATCIETLSRTNFPADKLLSECKPFLNSEHNRIRANIIVAIGKSDFSIVQESLSSMFQTTKISMRESAVYAISQLKPTLLLQKLLLKCLHDPYLDIRLRTIDILKNYNHPDVVIQMKRLANDLDIEICEAALETINKLEGAPKVLEETKEKIEVEAPFEHLESIEQKSSNESFEDFDEFNTPQDDFFETQDQDSIHIENDFISIDNNELDEFIIPPKPNQDKVEQSSSDFETPIEEKSSLNDTKVIIEDNPSIDTEQISYQEDDSFLDFDESQASQTEQGSLIKESLSNDLNDEFDLFAMDENSSQNNSSNQEVDLFSVDESSPQKDSITLDEKQTSELIIEQKIEVDESTALSQEPENTPINDDFGVFSDIEADNSFQSTKTDESKVAKENSIEPPKEDLHDDFDLFDFDESDEEDQKEEEPLKALPINKATPPANFDEFPDFDDSFENQSPEIDKSKNDDASNFEKSNSSNFIESPIKTKSTSDFIEEKTPPESDSLAEDIILDDEFIETTIDISPVQAIKKVIRISPSTQKSLDFLYETHTQIFSDSKTLKIELFFEELNLSTPKNLFEDYNDKDFSHLDQDWLPQVKINKPQQKGLDIKQISPKVEKKKPEIEQIKRENKAKEPNKLNTPNKELISSQISLVLKEIGTQSYQLCQEYDPENPNIEKIYNEILKIQSHLKAMVQGKIKATPKLNLKIIKRKLDQTFEKLGRLTLKETNEKRFVLHNSELYQKKIRTLVKKLNAK
ncbi:MAG: hypothetical protein COB02_01400 [Candidatus Cloacimonadota bacterium]|nr:MAG: hypothetical protein COB02_01400 [Candidatus Cloacimonadota bacterium]